MDRLTAALHPKHIIIFGLAGVLALCLVGLTGWILLTGALYPQIDQEVVKSTNSSIFPDIPQPELTIIPEEELPTAKPEAEEPQTYTVEYGDSLGYIALEFGVSIEMIVQANQLINQDVLEVGQVLIIPQSNPGLPAPDFKIIPDSELVYSPGNADFDTLTFVQDQNGYLAVHQEEVHEKMLNGAEIVQLVAVENSVNPRLLLAVLEYQSGWVSGQGAAYTPRIFNQPGDWRIGLYSQLSWAADQLNRGFYLWRINAADAWTLRDGSLIPVNPTVNAGTAAVQHLEARLLEDASWRTAVGAEGVFAAYNQLFGSPFDFAYEPLLPDDLVQPEFQLPFESGVRWVFTGGPHGGWGAGSAWAGLDFAPYGDPLGCVQSDAWVVAMADGWIVRSENGAVVQDLDHDQNEHTGWTMLYMHIETRDRVSEGQYVSAGDRIGYPSCEGGYSTGSHVHLARRYNGEWIPADQDLPFMMEGWTSHGYGILYDGYLEKNDEIIEACECQDIENTIVK